MKKIVYLLGLLLFLTTTQLNATEVKVTEDGYDQVIKATNAEYYLKGGIVYVKGINSYGQLGLDKPIDNTAQYPLTALANLPLIKEMIYTDYTLTLVEKGNPNVKWLVGKNAYVPAKSYKALQNQYLITKNSPRLQRLVYDANGIKYHYLYKSNDYKKIAVSTTFEANKVTSNDYNDQAKLTTSYQYFYQNKQPYRNIIYTYNQNNQIITKTIYSLHSNLNRQKKEFYNLQNNKLVLANVTNYNSVGQKTQYLINKYDSKVKYVKESIKYNYYSTGKIAKKLLRKHRTNNKVYYSWYATFSKDNKRLGVTKKWYNTKNKLYKVDAIVEGITYLSQKDKRWANVKCKKNKIYNGNIYSNGCMMTSFAMINSKYNKLVYPHKLFDYGLNCLFDYELAAKKFGYEVQNTYPTKRYTRNANTSFYNNKKFVGTGKTYTIKDAILNHQPVQVWTTPKKKLHYGHSVVAYRYVYEKGKWDIKIYDPYQPQLKTRSLKGLALNQYITKAQIWVKVD